MTPSHADAPLFSVLVQPSGRAFNVAQGEAVLSAGIRQGIGMPYGCKDGACGSCKCKLVSGTVQHGTHQFKALSPEEESAGWVLTCCAVPQTDLVLESRQVTELGALPIKKMPVRVTTMARKSPDVMALQLQLPAATVCGAATLWPMHPIWGHTSNCTSATCQAASSPTTPLVP